MPWPIALGALASALHCTLPDPLNKSVVMFANTASPATLSNTNNMALLT